MPLSERGVPVAGIELSPDMAAVLRAKPGSADVPVTIGDMTSTRVPGAYSLVYLVFNTNHERHYAGRAGGGVRERGRAPGSGRALRGGSRGTRGFRVARGRARPGLRRLPRPRRDRHHRRSRRAGHVLAPLDADRRAVAQGFRAVPLRLAVGA
ncbi:MAG: hypothetical protein ACRDNO_23870 [Trebonia sp.]